MFEIMIGIDAAAAELGLETNFGIQDMIWCKEREREGSYEEMAQNNAASDYWTH